MPYGETWVEKTQNTGLESLPYKFTRKEMDEETGLYYYGARYLDPKYSRWISTDPALGEYVPQAPVNDEAKKQNQNLPGMGGVFNTVNLNLFHYAGNNPVRYIDPDGRDIEETPIISVSIGVLGAARASAGFAIDSDEAAAIYCKLELGIGAGTSIGLSKLFSGAIQKTFNLMSKIIGYLNNSMSGVEIGKDIVNIPEDTGAGNLEWKYLDCIDIRWETEKNWKTPPVEAALFIGLQVDKNNEWSLDAPSCIASAYLCSITIYVNIGYACDVESLVKNLPVPLIE